MKKLSWFSCFEQKVSTWKKKTDNERLESNSEDFLPPKNLKKLLNPFFLRFFFVFFIHICYQALGFSKLFSQARRMKAPGCRAHMSMARLRKTSFEKSHKNNSSEIKFAHFF